MDMAPVTGFAVLLARPGFVVMTVPLFGPSFAPPAARIGLTVILAFVVAPLVHLPMAATPLGTGLLVLHECIVGLALGLSVRLLVAGAELAGQLAGFQMGFGYGATVDPQTGARNNLLAVLYAMLTVFTCFAVNAHHVVIRTLVESYQVLPVGVLHVGPGLAGQVAAALGIVFTLGAQLAAPLVTVLVLVEIALGLLAHAAPVWNLMALGFPVRLLAGLAMLAGSVAILPGVVTHAIPTAIKLAARLAAALH